MTPFRRTVFLSGMAVIVAALVAVVWMPISAQDSAVFATNTAPAAPPSFATNTPQPTALVIAIPNASFDRYALRRWDEVSLTATLLDQIVQLKPGETDRQEAVRLLQHELQQRFPGAPHDAVVRDQLLQAMLRAPRGSVDMRSLVWATLEAALNQGKPDLSTNQSLQYENFGVTIVPTKLDGDNRSDAILGIDYPAGASAVDADQAKLLFESYVLARTDENGVYHVLVADYPAAPLGITEDVAQVMVGDTNGDRLSELVVSEHNRDDVNSEIFIFGWRNGGAANLVEPGEHMRYGRVADWVPGSGALTLMEYRVESPAWNCLGERPLTWTWSFNFFRPPEQLENFSFQNRLGCLLYGAEPLFEMPVQNALTTIDRMVPLATSEDTYAAQRAGLVQAMLHILNGEPAVALEQVKELQGVDRAPNSWLDKEITAFMNAAGASMTPVQFCAALQNASDYGACDVNQVLARLFKEEPFNRDEPIEAQASRLGLTVLDSLTLSQVGRLDRQAVHFDLSGNDWWAFAPLEENFYTAEKIDIPPGYELPSRAPTLLLLPPTNAFDALLVNNDPTEALNVLDNLIRMNPDALVDSSVRLMQALCYDQLGDRTNARQTYFDVWIGDPASVWGQLAAAHLEKR